MRIEVFTSFSELPASVVEKYSFPSQPDFFLSLDWYAFLVDSALCMSVTTRIYCAIDDSDDTVGILFCGIPVRSKNLQSLTNFYSMVYAPACSGASISTTAFMTLVADYVKKERPRWHSVTLRLLPRALIADVDVLKAFGDAGFFVSSFFMYENWYINIGERDFDSYYMGRPSKLRNTIKRKENKLRKSHNYEIVLHNETGDSMATAIEDFVGVYGRSWKNPEPFPKFIPGLISMTSALNILRLGLLYIDGKPAAAQLWITGGEKAVIYKLAYDEDYSEFSPGSILSREMFRHAIDVDKVAEIDYGVGSENYKKDWMEEVRVLDGIQAFNLRTASGMAWSAIETAKMAVRRIRNRSR